MSDNTKKYSHGFDLAFEIDSNHPSHRVPASEIRDGLRQLIDTLDDLELLETCGPPFDSFKRRPDGTETSYIAEDEDVES